MFRPGITKIVSGGQTGADRGGLDAAIELGLDHAGWCAKGRLAEDGPIPARYRLQESPSSRYPERAELNIRDSDATMIFVRPPLGGGARFTISCAMARCRPHLIVPLMGPLDFQAYPKRASPEHRVQETLDDWSAVNRARDWLNFVKPKTLNVAGPTERKFQGIQERARWILVQAIKGGG